VLFRSLAPPDLQKRRKWSASAALPPVLRSRFTPGENAVAAVIRAEVRRHGCCDLPYSAIAKSAGLSSTTVVKRFVREARRMRLIEVKERPVRGDRHKPNVITIVSRDWQTWNEVGPRQRGGGTPVPTHPNTDQNRTREGGEGAKCARGANGLRKDKPTDSAAVWREIATRPAIPLPRFGSFPGENAMRGGRSARAH